MARSRDGLLGGWGLFFAVTIAMCVAVVLKMRTFDMTDPENVSSMIQLSVRMSVPWLYLAFAASSLVVVLPSPLSRWMIRNRRYLGLLFAAGMAWQLTFIVWMVAGYWGYYRDDAYYFWDVAVQIPGYMVLTAMTLTSFWPGRRMLSSRQWQVLHRTGIYILWGTVWSTYWYEIFYYDDIQLVDHVFYWAGFAAWGARIWAWGRKRAQEKDGGGEKRKALVGLGLVAATMGVVGLVFGSAWAPTAWEILEFFGHWAPLFELAVPFIPIFLIAFGTTLLVRSKQDPIAAPPEVA